MEFYFLWHTSQQEFSLQHLYRQILQELEHHLHPEIKGYQEVKKCKAFDAQNVNTR